MRLLPDAVCWHEGMQLLPQHFQLQGLRAEAMAAHLALAANPWYWGVSSVEFDPSALFTGQVRVLALDATLPDGLVLNIRAGVGPMVELDIVEDVAVSPTLTVTVYLAISPLWRAGQLLPLKGRLQSALGDAIPDLASGEHPESISVWRPNPRLVTEANRADSICLPLLRLRKEGGGFVQLPFVAPTPRILPESLLGRRVAALCVQTREKCMFLAGRLRQAQQAGNQDDAAEVRRQSAALWARLPEVEGALNSRIAVPQALHGLLLGMAGCWSALDPIAGVPAYAPLDFLDLNRGYDEVLTWLERTLEQVRVGFRSLPFEQAEQVFSIQLPDLQPRQRLVIGLRMPAGVLEQAAVEWLGRAIIASGVHIPVLARQRMSGLAHQAMSRQEQVAYSVGDDTRLFVIQAIGQWFDPAQPLHIVSPVAGGAVSPWQVVLLIDNTHQVAE
ncbi:type VI secretion system baseplate subunit TssK [Pseudomonas sp. 10B1]|uniref:type VI secretion system baseplate subunit TssK n=1 Tax=unclassified Pseudomonas TaxID=196821 RepID=UPI002AB509C3|nr:MULTISPECIES: type VI secretion system baseplate subunit TssK [unclassified Pseudomonas]MDY7560401.1 type VI secretion system baseplate subunit TssK [Pseudomonas sp. AB6]MEA9994028.1 type VI secretion system baseplate subunit TssK [Pseudomonas sp. AA4]MEB0088637.1 type VI secretion system baseplate subunit TssK [Pseudomonas sp. RTI1]MEB0124354.1 type VI secretion system baseplate subunit TssK [Pseudomonas sp. CCC1.2]MEB0151880.1 type VI secretion system baseplate subunit TssK [Pseudomonas s